MARASERVLALDLLRGAAVAGMILATSPGDWAATYAQLQHAAWNGWTATDTIFPTFLFAVGMAQGLAFPASKAGELYWRRVGRRVVALIALGLALEATYNLAIAWGAWFPGHASLGYLRLPGILQRIGLCYGLTAVLLAATARGDADGTRVVNVRAIAVTIAVVLVGYAALLRFVPVPGYGAGRLDPEGSWPAFVDRAVFTVPHLWALGWARPDGPVVYDPEGLLSTFPAATLTLAGVLAAVAWRRQPAKAPVMVAIAGAAALLAGQALDPVLPINKRIFTSSFALVSSGTAALVLSGLAAAAKSEKIVRALAPLRVLGGNAIAAFTLSTLIGRVYGAPLIGTPDDPQSPAMWLDQALAHVLPEPRLASLACAMIVLGIVTAALWPLHRRGLHLRL